MAEAARTRLKQPIRIDFTGARSRAAMLEVVAKALKLPRHFGMNLDALHDCLTDLQFGSEPATITLVKLARTPAGESVFGVFRAARLIWSRQGAKISLLRE